MMTDLTRADATAQRGGQFGEDFQPLATAFLFAPRGL